MKQRKLITTKRVTRYRSPKTGWFIRKATAKRYKIKGEYYQETRMKGKLVKVTKWKPPVIAYMYRTTLAINYAWHRKYYSYKVTVYAKHRKDLPSKEQMRTILYEKFKDYRKYTVQDLKDSGMQIRIGHEKPVKIRLDKSVVDTTTYKDELLRRKRRIRRGKKR